MIIWKKRVDYMKGKSCLYERKETDYMKKDDKNNDLHTSSASHFHSILPSADVTLNYW